jgi:hypothetical protein
MTSMADYRSKIEKLEAMASQTASPQEAEVAGRLLERLRGTQGRVETPRRLTREDIKARPDRRHSSVTVTIRTRSGTYTFSEDEASIIFEGAAFVRWSSKRTK